MAASRQSIDVPQPDEPESEQENRRPDESDPFPLEITDILDLHTFSPKEVPAAVEVYLAEARAKGMTTVRIIHGKGIGMQRERVHSVLRRTPFVERFQDAPGDAGGWGATLAWFKPGLVHTPDREKQP